MTAPPRTPADNVAALIAQLGHAVVTRNIVGLLSQLLVRLITDRLREISQRFARIAARVGAGRYARRTVAAPRQRTIGPRRPDPLPRSPGWLLKLVPDAVGSRAQLEFLFRDAAMVELMAAAPASLSRPLRSLCRMLGVEPPAVLAAPARPRPPRPSPVPATAKTPPPHPQPPAWMGTAPRRRRWSLARICGPPEPA